MPWAGLGSPCGAEVAARPQIKTAPPGAKIKKNVPARATEPGAKIENKLPARATEFIFPIVARDVPAPDLSPVSY